MQSFVYSYPTKVYFSGAAQPRRPQDRRQKDAIRTV